jgi:NDP-sugar pyrophosphorylase family protein
VVIKLVLLKIILKRSKKITFLILESLIQEKNSNTGERLRRIKKYISSTFCLTYGDGLSNINIAKLIQFYKKNKSIATFTAIKPTPHFGKIIFKGNKVAKFLEKNILILI